MPGWREYLRGCGGVEKMKKNTHTRIHRDVEKRRKNIVETLGSTGCPVRRGRFLSEIWCGYMVLGNSYCCRWNRSYPLPHLPFLVSASTWRWRWQLIFSPCALECRLSHDRIQYTLFLWGPPGSTVFSSFTSLAQIRHAWITSPISRETQL